MVAKQTIQTISKHTNLQVTLDPWFKYGQSMPQNPKMKKRHHFSPKGPMASLQIPELPETVNCRSLVGLQLAQNMLQVADSAVDMWETWMGTAHLYTIGNFDLY